VAGDPAPAQVPVLHLADSGLSTNQLGYCTNCFTVNPIQTVRWQIGVPKAGTDPLANMNPTNDASKFNLYRNWVDATGKMVDVKYSELVAEYAVDLKFSFSACIDAGQCKGTVATYAPGAAEVGLYAKSIADSANNVPGMEPTPQRIRSVTVQLSARAALADRKTNVVSTSGAGIYRYCVNPDMGACSEYARVRTLFEDVGLPNQAKMRF
jgi:hypothetical protein